MAVCMRKRDNLFTSSVRLLHSPQAVFCSPRRREKAGRALAAHPVCGNFIAAILQIETKHVDTGFAPSYSCFDWARPCVILKVMGESTDTVQFFG